MSHYAQTPKLQIKDAAELAAALRHQGYIVEVHEQPQHLYGYRGDRRHQVAHVIVRRQHTGIASSNDIGFLREADGSWTAQISEYDTRQKFGASWVLALTRECGVQRAMQRAARLGQRVVRGTDQKGRTVLEITGRF